MYLTLVFIIESVNSFSSQCICVQGLILIFKDDCLCMFLQFTDCVFTVQKALDGGVTPVIVDNTNVTMWEMFPYAAMVGCFCVCLAQLCFFHKTKHTVCLWLMWESVVWSVYARVGGGGGGGEGGMYVSARVWWGGYL